MTSTTPDIHVETFLLEEVGASWDEEQSGQQSSVHSQTSCYARYEKAYEPRAGFIFLRARHEGIPVGWLVIRAGFKYHEFLPDNAVFAPAGSLAYKYLRTFSWYLGPVLADGNTALPALKALLARVDVLAEEMNVARVKYAIPPSFDPGRYGQDMDRIYMDAGYTVEPRDTVILDIRNRSMDDLWKGLTKDARRSVRKGRTQGLEVIEADCEEHVRAYYGIRRQNARRNGLRIPGPEYFLNILSCYPDNAYKVFLATVNGQWVAGQIAGVFNGNIILIGLCHSDYARKNTIYGTDYLQWHIIEWARNNGANYIDWVGYTPEPADEHQRGINRYKLKWGGEVVSSRQYMKTYSPCRSFILDLPPGLAALGRTLRSRGRGFPDH